MRDELHAVTAPATATGTHADWTTKEADYWRARHLRRKSGRRAGTRSANLKVLEEGRCRLCHATEADLRARRVAEPPRIRVTKHHLIPVSDRGTNAAENIVPLCRYCHDLVDCGAWPARVHHRVRLRAALLPAEVAYLARERGAGWLAHHYPEDPNAWIGSTPA